MTAGLAGALPPTWTDDKYGATFEQRRESGKVAEGTQWHSGTGGCGDQFANLGGKGEEERRAEQRRTEGRQLSVPGSGGARSWGSCPSHPQSRTILVTVAMALWRTAEIPR
jgi:hypothetical protein